MAETPALTDIAFHPDGRLFGCVSANIYQIDSLGFVFPKLALDTLFEGDVTKFYFTGMTFDHTGLMWLSGHNSFGNKRAIFTYDLKSAVLTTIGLLPWEKGYSDLEWFNGEIYSIGESKITLGNDYEIMLTKMNFNNIPLSTDILLGFGIKSWGLVAINDLCQSEQLFSTHGTNFPDARGLYVFNEALDTITYQSIPTMCAATGATSRTSWLGSYTPLGIDTVTFEGSNNNCSPPYTMTAHLRRGYYMRPDIEFSLDGVNFQSDSVFTGLLSGRYVVHVQDSFGCSKQSDTILVGVHDFIHSVETEADYCGLSDGAFSVDAVGYDLSSDGISFVTDSLMLSGLSAGFYTYYVRDTMGCMDTASVEIESMPPFSAVLNAISDTCGLHKGSVSFTPTNPSNQVSISLDDVAYFPGYTLSGLSAGMYSVWLQDSAGCKIQQQASVPELGGVSIQGFDLTLPDCNASDGFLVVHAAGDILSYVLNTNSNNTGVFSNLNEGNYSLVITDAYGCSHDTSLFIQGQHSSIVDDIMMSDAHCDLNNGSIDITMLDQAVIQLSMDSINFIPGNTLTELPAGDYTIYIKNEAGCLTKVNATIEQTGLPSIDEILIQDEACDESNGSVIITATGHEPLTYLINGSASAIPDFSNLSAGIYTLEVADVYGCTVTQNIEIHDNEPSGSPAFEISHATCEQPEGILFLNGYGSDIFYEIVYTEQVAYPGDTVLLSAGSYLLIIHEGECVTDTVIHVLKTKCPYFIPNIFSPNYDQINDEFKIEGDVEVLDMRIFDRWGGCLYSGTGIDASWDGTFRSSIVQPGVYVYWIKLRMPDGIEETKKGNVTVIR